MSLSRRYFEDYIGLFPAKYAPALKDKLRCKRELEKDAGFAVPARIWLAFLTPPDKKAIASVAERHKKVAALKELVLDRFDTPQKFIGIRDPRAKASECVTLALLEILYDLGEKKVLLKRKGYDAWLDVANHFGLWKLRYVLEDAIFRTFDPKNYELFGSVVEKQLFVDKHLVLSVRGIVESAFGAAGLSDFSIENREKNIYGVYRKVALKQKSINDIYDIHGFRIIMRNKEDCYRALEVLHKLWRHYPDRFKDYIAEPKDNGYMSIHTVLNCLENKTIEFQIRTREMDIVAASGPANHAEYKKSSLAAA